MHFIQLSSVLLQHKFIRSDNNVIRKKNVHVIMGNVTNLYFKVYTCMSFMEWMTKDHHRRHGKRHKHILLSINVFYGDDGKRSPSSS